MKPLKFLKIEAKSSDIPGKIAGFSSKNSRRITDF